MRQTILDTCQDIVLSLACLLGFLVPLGVSKSINLQAGIVIIMGVFGWTAVALRRHEQAKLHDKWRLGLVALYCLCILISLLAHPTWQNVAGTPLVRLGSFALLGAVGSALALSAMDRARVEHWLYVSLSALSILSIPYTIVQRGHIGRLDGFFHQADVLAVVAAVALIYGVGHWKHKTIDRRIVAVIESLLLAVIWLSQTRVVIALVLVLAVFWAAQFALKQSNYKPLIAAVVLVAASVAGIHFASPARVRDTGFARDSVAYRLALQSQAVKSIGHQPIAGYGAGGISNALTCGSFRDPALLQTCHDGYYFDSSHNIFLDRIIALGWLGGSAFIIATLYALARSFTAKTIQPEAYALLLIVLYYLTNVTDIEVELLFWVTLFCGLPLAKLID